MSNLLSVSSYNYTLACATPIVQQVVGPISILKNSIGTVNDISNAILSFQSFSAINIEISEMQKVIKRTVSSLEHLRKSNARLKVFLESVYHSGFEFDLNPAIEALAKQQSKWKLPPLTDEFNKMIPKEEAKTSMASFITLNRIVDLKMQIEISRLKNGYEYLESKRCTPICDRMDNIANAILTTIPFVGTLYNGYSLITLENSEV